MNLHSDRSMYIRFYINLIYIMDFTAPWFLTCKINPRWSHASTWVSSTLTPMMTGHSKLVTLSLLTGKNTTRVPVVQCHPLYLHLYNSLLQWSQGLCEAESSPVKPRQGPRCQEKRRARHGREGAGRSHSRLPLRALLVFWSRAQTHSYSRILLLLSLALVGTLQAGILVSSFVLCLYP